MNEREPIEIVASRDRLPHAIVAHCNNGRQTRILRNPRNGRSDGHAAQHQTRLTGIVVENRRGVVIELPERVENDLGMTSTANDIDELFRCHYLFFPSVS